VLSHGVAAFYAVQLAGFEVTEGVYTVDRIIGAQGAYAHKDFAVYAEVNGLKCL
jgi:hypothetical protein